MKPLPVVSPAAIDSIAPVPAPTHGGRLALARAVWLGVAALCALDFALNLPILYARLERVCVEGACAGYLTLAGVRELQAFGLAPGFFPAYAVALNMLYTLVWFATGALIAWKAQDLIAVVVALVLVTTAVASFTGDPQILAQWPPLWRALGLAISFVGNSAIVLFFFFFPDGRFVPRLMIYPAVAGLGFQVLFYFFPDVPLAHSLGPSRGIVSLFFLGAALLSQLYRYLYISTPGQRRQTRWVVAGCTVAILGSQAANLALPRFFPESALWVLFAKTVFYAALLAIPFSLAVAILRYRLWDIRFLVNRALVYGLLTGSIVLLYVLVVGSLGALFQARGNLLVSLAGAGLVAVLFEPLRMRLQQGINRLMYGRREEPYMVLSQLGERLEAALAPEAVLPLLVETVAHALVLPYVAVRFQGQGKDADGAGEAEGRTVAAYGSPVEPSLVVPLVYQGQRIGDLVAGRAPGQSFHPADRRLLADLARQAGVAAHAVRLNAELQEAREHLVVAREEERRRLRRDLHDGLGPTLGGLTLKVGTARYWLGQNPQAADRLLAELEGDIARTVADIRRLVYALRPPALDELGLVGALRELAAQMARLSTEPAAGSLLRITVDAPDRPPPLPAAVEVAAFRIVQEALTNVVRHAHARNCTVRLTFERDLVVTVIDDGTGFARERRQGVGSSSLFERAAELGGKLAIESPAGGGTRVEAHLPLRQSGAGGGAEPEGQKEV